MKAQRFLGKWRLIPQLCKYDHGHPPLTATYSFALDQLTDIIDVNINWTDQQDKNFHVNYKIELNKKIAESMNGIKIQVYHELSEKGTLDSTSFNESGEKILMKSSRELKEDGRLEVIMDVPTQKGSSRIYQLYEKIQ